MLQERALQLQIQAMEMQTLRVAVQTQATYSSMAGITTMQLAEFIRGLQRTVNFLVEISGNNGPVRTNSVDWRPRVPLSAEEEKLVKLQTGMIEEAAARAPDAPDKAPSISLVLGAEGIIMVVTPGVGACDAWVDWRGKYVPQLLAFFLFCTN